ncbi:MAG: Phosphoadenosine phosphosulfate reductase [Steroidobacteraceae bacterium]|nr:Phosphoadenosine phosphosulfate reductase [Steroidobacteraceae bacterium]
MRSAPAAPTASQVAQARGGDAQALDALNAALAPLTATERIGFAFEHLPGTHILSSSFGAQAAVALHLATQVSPDVPVVLVDTGYLFPETYRFIDELTLRLKLNLQVAHPPVSAAWIEARHGKLWENGVEGLDQYGRIAKVEPMQRKLEELGAGTWISGLRRAQSTSRAAVPFLALNGTRFKLHPIADWTDRDVGHYLKHYALPYHPLWEQGYVSIGDWHTTRSLTEAGSIEGTRFFGLKRECGLHGLEG